MSQEEPRRGEVVKVRWLDHFQFDNRFGSPLDGKDDLSLSNHAETVSVGKVKSVSKHWLVLSQNWPEEDENQDAGIAILRAGITEISKP